MGVNCMSWKKFWFQALFFVVIILLITVSVQAEQNLIGKWLDKVGSFEQEITIAQEGKTFFLISKFQDGSSGRHELIKVNAKTGEKRRFKDPKSDFGEFYAIDNAGNLDLYDKEGFIREAKKYYK